MKEGYEKYCRFYMCEEKECWYNGCQCEGERLIIPKETFDKDVERSYSEEDMRESFIAGGNSQIEEDDAYGSAYLEYMEEWFEQFKKK